MTFLVLLVFSYNVAFLFVGTASLGLFLSSTFPSMLAYTEDILQYKGGCAGAQSHPRPPHGWVTHPPLPAPSLPCPLPEMPAPLLTLGPTSWRWGGVGGCGCSDPRGFPPSAVHLCHVISGPLRSSKLLFPVFFFPW